MMDFIQNFFLVVFIAALVIVIVLLLVLFYLLRKGIRYLRRFSSDDMSDEEFERLSKKNYRKQDGPSFNNDYFKGSGWQRNQQQQQQQQQSKAQRTTRTADGVTIVDRRDPQKTDKKIFAQDEGEYVDFTEN